MRIDVEIQAGKTAKHPVEGRYLHFVSATGNFSVAAKGVGEIEFGAGGYAEIPAGVKTLEFRDKSDSFNQIELENTDVIKRQSGEQVEVVNNVVVQRIEEPLEVTVTSQAEFAEGTEFGVKAAGSVVDLDDVPVNSGASVQIVAANASRKKLLFSITAPDVSSHINVCRLGGSTLAAGKGVKYFAGKGAVAVGELEVVGPVHIYNEGQETVIVSVSEVLK